MFKFDFNDKKYKNIHFIGIGGISMSGIAKLLLKKGYSISGSDRNTSKEIQILEQNGAKIFIGRPGADRGRSPRRRRAPDHGDRQGLILGGAAARDQEARGAAHR